MEESGLSVPGVSVIMPVYNVEAYVGDAIQSVLAQTWRNFELIVIDDGSTDSSVDISRSYAALDSRIRLLSQPNHGLSAARNRGIAAAKGDYLYFFDADDILGSDALAVCMAHIKRYGLDFITFSGRVFSDSDTEKTYTFPGYQKPDILVPHTGQELLLKLNSLNAYSSSVCLCFFLRKILSDTNLRFDEGYLHEDEGFTPLLYCSAHKAISLKKMLFNRRIREQSIMTGRRSPASVKGLIQSVIKINDFLCSERKLSARARRFLRDRQRRLLRNSVSIAREIGFYSEFRMIIRDRFGLTALLLIDPLALLYIGFERFFFLLRDLKRAIFGSGRGLK